jgi:hypothetical protein
MSPSDSCCKILQHDRDRNTVPAESFQSRTATVLRTSLHNRARLPVKAERETRVSDSARRAWQRMRSGEDFLDHRDYKRFERFYQQQCNLPVAS